MKARAAVYVSSVALTIAWCGSMSAMPGMPWMRMPGQSWPGAAGEFVGMWAVMMVAMMLPVVAQRVSSLAAAAGYFGVWVLAGAVIYPLGMALEARVPMAGALAAVVAGALQFTRWKQRSLNCCRAKVAATSWQAGAALGWQCLQCCFGLTLLLLALGVMDLRAMALVTALITVERLAPRGERWARGVGIALIASGIFVIAATPQPW